MIAWCRHITEADLHFFQQRAEDDVVIPGAGKWEHMTDLRLDSLTYTAWRRRLPVSLHYTPARPPFSMFVTSTMHHVWQSWLLYENNCIQNVCSEHTASNLAILALVREQT